MGDTKKPKPIIATSSSSRSPVLYYALFSAPLGLLVGFQNLLPGRTLSLMSSGSGSLSPGWLFAGILGWYTSLLVRFPFQMALQNYYAKASISSVCSVSSVSSVSTVSSVSPVSTVSTVSSSALDPLLIKKTDGDDGGHLHGPGCSHNHHHNQQQPLSLQDLQNVQLPPWAYSLLNAVTAFSETFVRQVLLMYLLGNSSLSTTTTTTPPHVLLLTSSMAWSRAFSLSLGWMLIETVAFCARFSMMVRRRGGGRGKRVLINNLS